MKLWNTIKKVLTTIGWGIHDNWFGIVIGLIIVGVLTAAVIGIDSSAEWEHNCRAKGGLVVKVHGDGEACVDSERRIIEP